MMHKLIYFFLFSLFVLLVPACSKTDSRDATAYIIQTEDLKTTLETSKGHYIVLHYWATWCKECIPELKSLAELQDRHEEQGLKVIAISVDDPQNQERLNAVQDIYEDTETLHGRFISGDETKNIMTAVDTDWLEIVPVTYLIHPEGNVVERYIGKRSLANLKLEITRIYR